jgi:DNA-binding response OmpR family regulator
VDVVLDLIRSGDVSVDGGLEVAEPALAPGATILLSVLLVEADQAAAARAIEALETRLANVEVEYAPDVASAIELARRPGWAIALIDGQLPNGGGVGLLEALRRRNPGLPIVMISEEGADQDIVEAFRHGAADCVLRRHGYVDELTNRVRTLAQSPSRGGPRLG